MVLALSKGPEHPKKRRLFPLFWKPRITGFCFFGILVGFFWAPNVSTCSKTRKHSDMQGLMMFCINHLTFIVHFNSIVHYNYLNIHTKINATHFLLTFLHLHAYLYIILHTILLTPSIWQRILREWNYPSLLTICIHTICVQNFGLLHQITYCCIMWYSTCSIWLTCMIEYSFKVTVVYIQSRIAETL